MYQNLQFHDLAKVNYSHTGIYNKGAQNGKECISGILFPVSLLRRLSGGYFLSSPVEQHAYMGEREG
jgi:hypothetical protein